MLKRLALGFLVLTALASLAAAAPGQLLRSQVRVATSGEGFLVVWNEGDHVRGMRLTPDGLRLDASRGFVIAGGAVGSVDWNGSEYLVGYATPSKKAEIVAVSTHGTVGAPRQVASSDSGVVEIAAGPASTVVATYCRTVVLEGDNVLLDSGVAPFAFLTVAASDHVFIVSGASSDGFTSWRVYDRLGREINGCCLYIGLPTPENPTGLALASNGIGFLQLWTDAGRRLNASPMIMNGSGGKTPVSAVPFAKGVTSPRIAWDGLQYVATVSAGGTLEILRYASDGRLGGWPIAIEPMRVGESADVAAHDDGRGAVAWIRENGDIRVGLFDPASLASGAPFFATTDVNRAPRRRAVR